MAQPSHHDLHHHLVLPHHDYPPPPLLSSVSSAMIIVIITPHQLPHKLRNCDICLMLDSRQKRVLPLVKYAPSNSCVPPAMAAVAVRIMDWGAKYLDLIYLAPFWYAWQTILTPEGARTKPAYLTCFMFKIDPESQMSTIHLKYQVSS